MPLTTILLLAGLALGLRLLAFLPRRAPSGASGAPVPMAANAGAASAGALPGESGVLAHPLAGWAALAASVVCLYALQPALPVRYLDFWLPTLTLLLTVLGWLLTAAPAERSAPGSLRAAALIAGLVALVGLTRYLGGGDLLVRGRPPAFEQVAAALAAAGLLMVGVSALARRPRGLAVLLAGAVLVLIALLVVLKTPALSLLLARALRGLMGQNSTLATPFDIRWLGFSYICFRLIHTLRDRQAGRLEGGGLREYATYVLFFPAVVAGPIDRLERFRSDLRCREPLPADLDAAGRRLALGMFKKFVLADTLSLVALSPLNAGQVRGAGWAWVLLYAYAFQIYFDFSGYTDIAVGLGRLLGVRLPENFAAPYRKPNLAQFWNSWHMSLTAWFRAYYFNPVVRFLRGRFKAPAATVMLLTQVSTMILIGLWHGVTWNFVLWGAWHGAGLFIQNRWTDFIRPRAADLAPRPRRALDLLSTLLTFHFVALGWVFFALDTPQKALLALGRLFGL